MKKTLSFFILFLASVMLAGVFPSAASARTAEKVLRPIGGDPQPVLTPGGTGYSDVSPDAWYHGSVEYVSKTGLMVGVSKDIFDPNGKLTRAMTVTVLYRLAGSPATEGKGPFSDVSDGEWYSEPVKWASRKGVTLGVSETAFDPNGIITRADFATMLYRNGVSGDRFRTDASGEKNEPADVDKIPDYAREPVTALFRAGIVQGKGNGVFDPLAAITRAEAAAMIERIGIDLTYITPMIEGSADKCTYVSGDDRFYAVHGTDGVAAIISEHRAEFAGRGKTSADRLAAYGEDFFADKTLAVAFISVSSGSVNFSFSGVEKSGDEYEVDLDSSAPSVGTSDMATWCIIAEIPEKDVPLSRIRFFERTGKTKVEIGVGLTDSLGIDFRVSAWIDNMPSTNAGNWKKNVTVKVERREKTGEPIPDVTVSMAVGDKKFDLVRDPGYPEDLCTFRATEEDLSSIVFARSGDSYAPFRGKLTFSFGEFSETVSFSVPVAVTY